MEFAAGAFVVGVLVGVGSTLSARMRKVSIVGGLAVGLVVLGAVCF
jgi:hypothetical protein